jgi:hypothetical protein
MHATQANNSKHSAGVAVGAAENAALSKGACRQFAAHTLAMFNDWRGRR